MLVEEDHGGDSGAVPGANQLENPFVWNEASERFKGDKF